MTKPLLLCLIGKSGSGKSTIASRLERKYGYVQARSYTTRPMRDDPEDANTHTFITHDQVADYKDDIVAYNEYNNNSYFVTRQMLEGCQLYVVDATGLRQIKQNYKDKEIFSIYIECDSSIASARMEARGDDDVQILQRLQFDEKEFEDAKELCDLIIPNEVQNGINDIVDWIDRLYRYYRVKGA